MLGCSANVDDGRPNANDFRIKGWSRTQVRAGFGEPKLTQSFTKTDDAVWGEMMAALGAKAPFSASNVGISYMLLGEPDGGGVSNSDPYHEDPQSADDYTETGPHLMIIVPKEALAGISDDPSSGGPYVM